MQNNVLRDIFVAQLLPRSWHQFLIPNTVNWFGLDTNLTEKLQETFAVCVKFCNQELMKRERKAVDLTYVTGFDLPGLCYPHPSSTPTT